MAKKSSKAVKKSSTKKRSPSKVKTPSKGIFQTKSVTSKASLKPPPLAKTKPTKEKSSGSALPQSPTKASHEEKLVPKILIRDSGDPSDLSRRWKELKQKYGSGSPSLYDMTETYPVSSPIEHKTFGWGFILNSENDRLEVLFQTGVKQLISNYKKT